VASAGRKNLAEASLCPAEERELGVCAAEICPERTDSISLCLAIRICGCTFAFFVFFLKGRFAAPRVVLGAEVRVGERAMRFLYSLALGVLVLHAVSPIVISEFDDATIGFGVDSQQMVVVMVDDGGLLR
jgi:hypothetical protein